MKGSLKYPRLSDKKTWLIGQDLTLGDLEELDEKLYASLKWILENNVDILEQSFAYELDLFGDRHLIELLPEGANMKVTEANKKAYVKLFADAKIRKEVSSQIEAFLYGFESVLPSSSLKNFSPSELGLIIAGAQTIDIKDMKAHAEVSGNFNVGYMKMFMEILEEFDQNKRSAFLFFISGSSKAAHGGFKEHPIAINHLHDSDMLPVAHTW